MGPDLSSAPRIVALSTAVPGNDVQTSYAEWAAPRIEDDNRRKLFRRMVARGGISHRYSVLDDASAFLAEGSFYMRAEAPGTAERMRAYAREAPPLAEKAARGLADLSGVTHIVLASCTGFMAPGLDQIIARQLGLSANVERVSIGFIGCYAGITALRTAGHIVRSRPGARVLVICVELCTLHLQPDSDVESLLAMAQFADGAAAALVTDEGPGLALGEGISATLTDSQEMITWTVTDTGFAMHLSGAVPGRLSETLDQSGVTGLVGKPESWAVHPGGRSILDAVERGLGLPADALAVSRAVLADYGNMSSATVLFVLARIMEARPASGVALAFGPGLAMEGLHYGWTDAG